MKKNKFNPVFIVDMTACENVADLISALNDAKVNAGLAINLTDYYFELDNAFMSGFDCANGINAQLKKNTLFTRIKNWFKRK